MLVQKEEKNERRGTEWRASKAGSYRAAIKLSGINNGGGDLVTLSVY